MNWQGLRTVFLLMLVVSCGEKFKMPDDSLVVPTIQRPEITEIPREILLTEELVVDHVSLGHVLPGDKIIMRFKGKKFIKKFSDVYERQVPSFWKERECEYEPHFDPRFNFLKLRRCTDERREGHCNLKYRDLVGEIATELEFPPEVQKVRLRFKIGASNQYQVGNIDENKGLVMTTSFIVSEAMLQDSTELILEILKDPAAQPMQIGFLGYGNCEGQGKNGFGVNGSTASSQVMVEERQEFTVNAVLERIEEGSSHGK